MKTNKLLMLIIVFTMIAPLSLGIITYLADDSFKIGLELGLSIDMAFVILALTGSYGVYHILKGGEMPQEKDSII